MYLFAIQITSVWAGSCLTIKYGRGGIHSLIYCGLGGHGLHGPTLVIFTGDLGDSGRELWRGEGGWQEMVLEVEEVTYQASMSEALAVRPYVILTGTNPTILFGCSA